MWFRKWGWIYWPTSLAGWVITVALLAFIVWIFIAVDRHSHSASDTLMSVFAWAWIGSVTVLWVASKTSNH